MCTFNRTIDDIFTIYSDLQGFNISYSINSGIGINRIYDVHVWPSKYL